MSVDMQPSSKKARWTRNDLMVLHREDLVEKVLKKMNYIEYLQSRQQTPESIEEQMHQRELIEKQRAQLVEGAQRESILVMRLTAKEQEVQELMAQLNEVKQTHTPSFSQLQSRLLDPSVNSVVQRLCEELEQRKSKIELVENDLLSIKFTPDSQIGKRLMARCRLLHQENEELGRMVSSGRIAKLDGDIALQKKLIQDMKRTEREAEVFLTEMDDDQEAMQLTIYSQQTDIRRQKDRLSQLETENQHLRAQLTENGIRVTPATGAPSSSSYRRSTDRDSQRNERRSPPRGRAPSSLIGNKRRREDSMDRYQSSSRDRRPSYERTRRNSGDRYERTGRDSSRPSDRGRGGSADRHRRRAGSRGSPERSYRTSSDRYRSSADRNKSDDRMRGGRTGNRSRRSCSRTDRRRSTSPPSHQTKQLNSSSSEAYGSTRRSSSRGRESTGKTPEGQRSDKESTSVKNNPSVRNGGVKQGDLAGKESGKFDVDQASEIRKKSGTNDVESLGDKKIAGHQEMESRRIDSSSTEHRTSANSKPTTELKIVDSKVTEHTEVDSKAAADSKGSDYKRSEQKIIDYKTVDIKVEKNRTSTSKRVSDNAPFANGLPE